MKAKLSYKSKRNIIIAIVILALLVLISTGTYFFMKGNEESSAAALKDNDVQIGEIEQENEAEEEIQGQNENQNPEEENNGEVTENEATTNYLNSSTTESATTTDNDTTSGTTTNNNGTTSTSTSDNVTTSSSTNDNGTTGETPSQEYISETTEEQTVLVSEDYWVEWSPLTIKATTTMAGLSINKKADTYIVEYYYQVDGNYPTTADSSQKREETVGETVYVTAEDKNSSKTGYIFDESYSGNVESGMLVGDGSLVLKLYFKEQFTVTYTDGVEGEEIFKDKTTSGIDYGTETPKFGEIVEGEEEQAPELEPERDGYNFVEWSPEVEDTVTENKIYTAIWEGLQVTKTRTAIRHEYNIENTTYTTYKTYVDQADDIITYTITVKNIGDDKASNITLTDDNHDVTVTFVKIAGNDIDIKERTTNNFEAGTDLLTGLSTKLEIGETIEVTVEYEVSQDDITAALATKNKAILNTATATLNDNTYTGTDKTDGKDGTEVKERINYTIEYYFNGVINDKYTINAGTSEDTEAIALELGVLKTVIESETEEETYYYIKDGYTLINYIGIDGLVNGSTKPLKSTDENNITNNTIRIYYGKAETTIDKEIVSTDGSKVTANTVNAGDEIEYAITVTNTGFLGTTITVTDELMGTTYVDNSANIEEPEITTKIIKDENGNAITDAEGNEIAHQVLSWNVTLPAAQPAEQDAEQDTEQDAIQPTTQTITFRVRTAIDSYGDVINNIANIVETTEKVVEKETETGTESVIETEIVTKPSNEVTTTVNEINGHYSEYKAEPDLNIILIVDESSSMNLSCEGQYTIASDEEYSQTLVDEHYIACAPSDREKTRLYNAMQAINTFIEQQRNTDNDITVIKFNEPSERSDKISTLNGTGYNTEIVYTESYNSNMSNYEKAMSSYYKATIGGKELNLNFDGSTYFKGSLDGKNYILASDGKAYEYDISDVPQSAEVIGSTRNSGTTIDTLQTAVSRVLSYNEIGDLSGGFGTFVNPAFELAKRYINESKTNVVIVLSDGSFQDVTDDNVPNYMDGRNELLGAGVDSIYSIAFGDDASESKLEEITNVYENGVKKVYQVDDADSLLESLEDATTPKPLKNNQTYKTENGVVTFTASNNYTITVSEKYPIVATYNTVDAAGISTIVTLFTCESETDLANYGLSIDSTKKTLTWNIVNCINNNNGITTVPNEVNFKYYVVSGQ